MGHNLSPNFPHLSAATFTDDDVSTLFSFIFDHQNPSAPVLTPDQSNVHETCGENMRLRVFHEQGGGGTNIPPSGAG